MTKQNPTHESLGMSNDLLWYIFCHPWHATPIFSQAKHHKKTHKTMHKYVHYSFVFQKSNTSSKANWHLQNHITFCTLVSRVIWQKWWTCTLLKSCVVHLQILELRTWQNFTWATHKINLLSIHTHVFTVFLYHLRRMRCCIPPNSLSPPECPPPLHIPQGGIGTSVKKKWFRNIDQVCLTLKGDSERGSMTDWLNFISEQWRYEHKSQLTYLSLLQYY